MTRNLPFTLVLIVGLSTAAFAGSIAGTVSPGKSVVYVDAIRGKTFPAPAQKALMQLEGLAFIPHVSVIQVGTTVEFLNTDTVQHHVFWPPTGYNNLSGHDLGTWPKGERKPFKFDHPGVVSLLCNVHPEMAGYIVVVPTPYFAQTDASGTYLIANVPDFRYSVVAWHEGMKAQAKWVSVSGTATVNYSLSK